MNIIYLFLQNLYRTLLTNESSVIETCDVDQSRPDCSAGNQNYEKPVKKVKLTKLFE